nr:Crp/Fnr family transcriptional regulator [Nocardiopsis alba]
MDVSRGRSWPARSPLARFSEAARADLVALGRHVDYAPDTTLMRQGEHSTHVLILLDGHVKVVTTSYNGKTVLLALRSRGDLVGELAGLDLSPRMATVQTAGPVSARALTSSEFHSFLETNPGAARTITGSVAAKLRLATERILDYSSHDVPARVARVLVRLLHDHGVRTPEGLALGIRVSQPELASIISASEAAVSKALTDLRGRGVVATGYRRFTVTDVPALMEQAGFPPKSRRIPYS